MIKLQLRLLVLLFSAGHFMLQSQAPTWSQDIAPILYKNCTSCHHTGALAPNSLMTYTEAFNYSFLIKQYVENNVMPPWPPDAKYKHLAHERVISQSDKDKISQWVLAGSPQGNMANAPVPPVYGAVKSQLSSIDYSAKMQNYMVNTSADLYRCFIIETNLPADKYASEIEVIPGNSSIVHHVLVYEDTTNVVVQKDSAQAGAGYTSFFGTGSNDSRLIGEWVPGTEPIKFPAGMGLKLRKNTRIVLQVHYPKGTYMKLDSTRVNIKFTDPANFLLFREVYLLAPLSEANLINGPLVIPPNVVKTFTALTTATVNAPLPYNAFTLLSIAPHMHLIGKQMKVFAIESGTNDTLPLINIPKWDFKWQGIYNFRNPIKLMQGSKMIAQSAYDNTSSNLANPNSPPKQVVQGESTSDEMMLVFFALTYYMPGDENIVVDNSPVVGLEEKQNGIVNTLQLYDIYPNPAKQNAKLRYFSPEEKNATVRIVSVEGKLISETPAKLQQGYHEISLHLESLSKGQYFVNIISGNITRTKSLIVYE